MTTRKLTIAQTKILDEVENRAYELIRKYHGCGQCSLLAIQQICGLKDDVLSKASVGLSGGVGGMRSTCGALTGAALALGIKYGRGIEMLVGPEQEAADSEQAAIDVVAKLAKWFEREFGSINCGDLRKSFLGTQLSREVPWQKAWMEQLGLNEYCAKIVATTARRAAAMLENPDLGVLDKV